MQYTLPERNITFVIDISDYTNYIYLQIHRDIN